MPTSEVTLFTTRYIHPPHYGCTKVSMVVMNGQFTSLSFHVNRPSHSWDEAISNCHLETSRSRSWMWSKGKVTSIRPTIWDTAILICDLEKSMVKVMSEVKGQGHILYPVSNRCTSFLIHLNRTWIRPIILEIYGQKNIWPWKNTSIFFKENSPNKKFLTEFLQNLIR